MHLPPIVSIHAPREGRLPEFLRDTSRSPSFDPRPCARGDSLGYADRVSDLLFRSTPLREGRRAHAPIGVVTLLVSIHAPARGATSIGGVSMPSDEVSIHAPARGATRQHRSDRSDACFDPRPCARGDLHATGQQSGRPSCFDPRPCARGDASARYRYHGDRVSIHAPARGATSALDRPSRLAWFRSTPLREGRPGHVDAVDHHADRCFDPRPCARGDCDGGHHGRCAACFDPRPCARGDLRPGRHQRRDQLFRSTPLREGRHASAAERCTVRRCFDPRPCARGDPQRANRFCPLGKFGSQREPPEPKKIAGCTYASRAGFNSRFQRTGGGAHLKNLQARSRFAPRATRPLADSRSQIRSMISTPSGRSVAVDLDRVVGEFAGRRIVVEPPVDLAEFAVDVAADLHALEQRVRRRIAERVRSA